jgi:alkylhydroperoxidase/carboxymuconolactone decarboxylase family protein
MPVDPARTLATLTPYRELGLVSARDIEETLALLAADHPLARAAAFADSIHLHIKVDDTAALPRATLAAVAAVENEAVGYVKFAHAGGVNVIFSSIPVSEDENLPGGDPRRRPFLDHLGLDLRRETADVRAAFDECTAIGRREGWNHAAQGGGGKAVFCCHTQVSAKQWLFPRASAVATRPIEVALGPLVVHDAKMGCDLRPIDPGHPRAREVVSCCGDSHAPAPAAPTHYYAPADLGRFGEVGRLAKSKWDKFMAYYTDATAGDSALTAREKALIGLAVAHAKQCPYCIDAYTGTCLDRGATPEQMHEAVHVAAALAAGIDLVHAVQMQNTLTARRAM